MYLLRREIQLLLVQLQLVVQVALHTNGNLVLIQVRILQIFQGRHQQVILHHL